MDDYGIYTAADANFFPGVVVQINALRLHGYLGKLAVIDTGLDPWMREYLTERGVVLISLEFLRQVRYTDTLSEETAGMRGWSFKAFGILHARLFKSFTFIDGDYIPLCNLQEQLQARIEQGDFLCTEDGWNTWNETHTDAVGVRTGTYMNINAGFFSASMEHHGAIMEEWRNLMTRRKPFDLWYGDQGALNVILDKYEIPKVLVGDKADWNQTWLNKSLAEEGAVLSAGLSPPVLRHSNGRRIFGWHGCGWYRYWHCIGIDHYRKDKEAIERMRSECANKLPKAVLQLFSELLFYDIDLVVEDHLLRPRPVGPRPLQEISMQSYSALTDKGTAHSYVEVYEALFAPYRQRDVVVLEIGVWSGGSLLMWAAYFTSGLIIGIDADLSHLVPDVRASTRIRVVEGNATNAELIHHTVAEVDIVIDDGSHVVDEQLASFHALLPKLRPGGLYVIEDIWNHDNALRLKQEIPGAEIIDRRHIKGRWDDILLVYRKPEKVVVDYSRRCTTT